VKRVDLFSRNKFIYENVVSVLKIISLIDLPLI